MLIVHQIWFQNRRQNDRRKSKPLLPHELIPHFRNGVPSEATKQLPSPQNSQDSPHGRAARRVEKGQELVASAAAVAVQSLLNEPTPEPSPNAAVAERSSDSIANTLATPPSSFQSPRQHDISPNHVSSGLTAAPSQQASKKRSHEEMTADQSKAATDRSPRVPKALKRTSSFIRLAVTADGSMRVRTDNEPTPSPPKERIAPLPAFLATKKHLARAHSDVTSMFREINPPPKVVGRSRDARTWEFFCDKSARDALSKHAEQEGTGSAVGAISLMRAACHKRTTVTSTTSRRRNVRPSPSNTRNKPSLVRAQSSMARLQSSDDTIDEEVEERSRKKQTRHASGSDSDKENWLPGTRHSAPTAARTRADSRTLHAHSSHSRPRGLTQAMEAAGDRGNRKMASPVKGKGDDLDCVQGLLSLSQGAWQ